jgi:hypothetical protein
MISTCFYIKVRVNIQKICCVIKSYICLYIYGPFHCNFRKREQFIILKNPCKKFNRTVNCIYSAGAVKNNSILFRKDTDTHWYSYI